jgi:hypothetical protein
MADHICPQPNLDEILADPLTVLLMQSDGVDPADVRLLLRKAQAARVLRADDEAGDNGPVRCAWTQPLAAIAGLPVLDVLRRHCRA